MRHETTTWNGEPAIRVSSTTTKRGSTLRSMKNGSRTLDSLTASERDEVTLELYLVPLREVAVAVGVAGRPTEHLTSLTAARRPGRRTTRQALLPWRRSAGPYLEVLDRAARIIAREIGPGIRRMYPGWWSYSRNWTRLSTGPTGKCRTT